MGQNVCLLIHFNPPKCMFYRPVKMFGWPLRVVLLLALIEEQVKENRLHGDNERNILAQN